MQAPPGEAAIPSLFADDSSTPPPASQPGLLAELEGDKPARRTSPVRMGVGSRHPRWLVAGVAFALAALVLAWILPGNPATKKAGATYADGTVPQAGMPTDDVPARPAVILDDPPPSRIVPGGGRQGFVDGTDADPMQLLREEPAAVAAPIVRRRPPPARADSDVDLLAALMHHAGRTMPGAESNAADRAGSSPALLAVHGFSDPGADAERAEAVSRALAACPAANTEAGLACRQAACSGHWGEHPSCPRPTTAPAPLE